MKTFGKTLKELRLKNNYTLQDVADYLGVAIPTVSRFESDEREPNLDKLKMLANFYDVPIDYFFDRVSESTSFGEQLKEIRISNGFKSARQLSLKTGISSATITRIENNTQKPNPETLKVISQHLLDTTYEELLKLAGYINDPTETVDKSLSDKEKNLILKSRKLSETQVDLILKLMDEMK